MARQRARGTVDRMSRFSVQNMAVALGVISGSGLPGCSDTDERKSVEGTAGVDGKADARQAAEVEGSTGIAFVDERAEFPRVRYADGQVSLNDRCPVRLVKLNRRMPPTYVNGHPVGFC